MKSMNWSRVAAVALMSSVAIMPAAAVAQSAAVRCQMMCNPIHMCIPTIKVLCGLSAQRLNTALRL